MAGGGAGGAWPQMPQMPQMDPDFQSPFTQGQSASTTTDSAMSPLQVLPNALRLSQSRARLAEESLRAMEEACREAWREIKMREQECLRELGQAETDHAALTRQVFGRRVAGLEQGNGPLCGQQEHQNANVLQEDNRQRLGGLTMQLCSVQEVESGRSASFLQEVCGGTAGGNFTLEVPDSHLTNFNPGSAEILPYEDSLSLMSRHQHSRVAIDGTPMQLKQIQCRIYDLQQQSSSLSAARLAIEAHLAPCLFSPDGLRKVFGRKNEGSSPDRLTNEEIWSNDGLARLAGPGNADGGGYGEGSGSLGMRNMDTHHFAGLLQRVQVAERAALEALQRARFESYTRVTTERALHGYMRCCQRELQTTADKLEDSQKQCDGLKKENKRLARRLRHQARLLGGEVETAEFQARPIEGEAAAAEGAGDESRQLELRSGKGSLQLLAAAAACLRRGLDKALAFISRLFLMPSGVSGLRIAQGKEFSEGPLSGLAPTASTEWETGPMWEASADDSGEFDEVWDAWGDDVEVIPRNRPTHTEEPWHTVFFIHVIFEWQEALT